MGVLTLSMKRLDRKKQREEKRRAWMREEMHRLAASLEHEKVDEYMTYLTDPKRMLWKNFVGGVARGLGMAVGFPCWAPCSSMCSKRWVGKRSLLSAT